MERLRIKLTYSNVMVTVLAVLVIGGGSAYAAAQVLPKNSVGTRQLRNGAVTGAKVKKGSLRRSDFAAGQLPAGARGETGPRGEAGPPGAAGQVTGEPLRSGETVRGTWSLTGSELSSSSVSVGMTSPSLPAPAPTPIEADHVVVAGHDDVPGDGCTGNAGAPVSAAGFVCIYTATSSRITNAEGLGSDATLAPPEPPGTPFGFLIAVVGEGRWFADGSWAYTAP